MASIHQAVLKRYTENNIKRKHLVLKLIKFSDKIFKEVQLFLNCMCIKIPCHLLYLQTISKKHGNVYMLHYYNNNIFAVFVYHIGSSEKTLTNKSVQRVQVTETCNLLTRLSKVDYAGADELCKGMKLKFMTVECETELTNLIKYTLADTGSVIRDEPQTSCKW